MCLQHHTKFEKKYIDSLVKFLRMQVFLKEVGFFYEKFCGKGRTVRAEMAAC